MTIFIIKLIACITMVFDHVKYAIPDTQCFITQYFGRISYPLFAFILTEGYVHTKNLKKYYIRLIISALISQIPFYYFRVLVDGTSYQMMLNIMFTLILGMLCMTCLDKIEKKYLSIPLTLIIIYIGYLVNVDYGWFGITTIVIFYIFKNNKIYLSFYYIVLCLIKYYTLGIFEVFNLKYIYYLIFTIAPLIIILMYNGKEGRKVKYFYYLFYPAHLTVLCLINYFLIA